MFVCCFYVRSYLSFFCSHFPFVQSFPIFYWYIHLLWSLATINCFIPSIDDSVATPPSIHSFIRTNLLPPLIVPFLRLMILASRRHLLIDSFNRIFHFATLDWFIHLLETFGIINCFICSIDDLSVDVGIETGN